MTNINNWQQALLDASATVFQVVFSFLPTVIAAIIVFLIGLFLAKFCKGITIKVISGLKLDRLFRKIGLEGFLEKAEVAIKIDEIIGNIVKWIIIFIFFIATVNILGLTSVSAVLNRVLAYVPTVLSAAFIITAGVLLAGVVESLVKGAVAQVDTKIGRISGKFASYLVVIFAILAAVNQLGIAQSLINILFMGVVAMLALGFGLAIGLGAKDLVAEILKEWYENLKKEIKK